MDTDQIASLLWGPHTHPSGSLIAQAREDVVAEVAAVVAKLHEQIEVFDTMDPEGNPIPGYYRDPTPEEFDQRIQTLLYRGALASYRRYQHLLSI